MKLYICVLDEVPDYIVPTLVAHSVLNAHLKFQENETYQEWLKHSFKKCVCRVGRREFEKISRIPGTHMGHENKTLDGQSSCAIPLPVPNELLPNVLKYAKLWSPK